MREVRETRLYNNGQVKGFELDFALTVKKIKDGTLSIAKAAPQMIGFIQRQNEAATLKECKAQAAAIEAYLRQHKDVSAEEFNAAIKVKESVAHRLGQILAETVRPGRPKKNCDIVSQLPDGIDRKPSSRSQQLAGIPWKKIEAKIEESTKANERASHAKIVRELLKEQKQRDFEEAAKKAASESKWIPDLHCCEMESLLAKISGVDAIITDPPYPEEFLPLYESLARLAAKSLRENGTLAVMCGQSYLPKILELMTPHIAYRWTMAYLTPGGQSVQLWQRQINTFWKPVLIFGNATKWAGDVIKSDVNDNDKRFHGWGQSESGMARLVEALTKPGEKVCDPFLGAGTTGVVCIRLARNFVGCDIDKANVENSRKRMLVEKENGI